MKTPWCKSVPNASRAVCRSCEKFIDNKPLEGCTQVRHHTFYVHNKSLRNKWRAEKRKADIYFGSGTPEQRSKRAKAYYRKTRVTVITRLGGKCFRCGLEDIRCLEVDHINGGGSKERKSISGYPYLKRLRELPETELQNYQVLCANCHRIKTYYDNG